MEHSCEGIRRISVSDACDLIKRTRNDQDVVVLDVRTPSEVSQGSVSGSLQLDVHDATFASRLESLDRNKTYIVYCHTGGRSTHVAEHMRAIGFGKLYTVVGLVDELLVCMGD